MERSPRRALLQSLQRCAAGKGEGSGIDAAVQALDDSEGLAWAVTVAYSQLLRKDGGLPDGTVFTPPWLANEVIGRLESGLPVVDLGAGSGMLTLAAARKGFRVVAIEEDKDLATVLDSLARIMGLRSRIELRVGDALTYSRRKEAQIMSNPPFTRHNSIPAQKKRMLAELASKFEVPLQLTTGYYGYFMAYAWASGWSRREVLLLPTNWLEARYGQALRQMLFGREYEMSIVENGHHTPVFDHALTTICLLTTWPRATYSEGPRFLEVESDHWDGTEEGMTALVKVLKGPNGGASGKGAAGGRLVSHLIPKLANSSEDGQDGGHVLGDVFRVRRGAATGDNAFFVISLSEARKLGIERQELVRVLRRLRSGRRPKDTAYLWSPTESPSEASLRRIKEGEGMGVNHRYLCSHRKPWWRVENYDPPVYFLAYMGRGQPRIVENRGRLLNLNNAHGLYVKEGMPIGMARRIVKWLGSKEGGEALVDRARHYYKGMWKLEPHDVEQMSLPTRIAKYAGLG